MLGVGPANAPPLILLHGMRDVAWSLLPVALPLAQRYAMLEPYGMFIVFGLLYAGAIRKILDPVLDLAITILGFEPFFGR